MSLMAPHPISFTCGKCNITMPWPQMYEHACLKQQGTFDPTTPAPSIQVYSFPQRGWECPRCTRIWGPAIGSCFNCNADIDLRKTGV